MNKKKPKGHISPALKETLKETSLLNQIEKIVTLASEHGLSKTFFDKAKSVLKTVADTLEITETQACLFSLILEHSGNDAVSMSKIAENYKCGRIQFLKYLDDLEVLEKKKLIRPYRETEYSVTVRRRSGKTKLLPRYNVPIDVIKAVQAGKPYKDTSYINLNPEDFYAEAYAIFEGCRDGNYSYEAMAEELKLLLANNKKIAFMWNLRKHKFKFLEIILLLYMCCLWTEEDEENFHFTRLYRIIGIGNAKQFYRKLRINNPLLEKGFIEAASDSSVADRETFKLTDKTYETFLSDISIKDLRLKNNNRFIIKYADIPERKLFYSDKIKGRIDELTELLQEENFNEIKKRLQEKKMRTVFTCIFSGAPGTGKTETVYQIARNTLRDIYLVDISETKSMWFGESEKRIKALFDRYRGILKEKLIAPILLFNEADGVLSKRQELGETRRGPAHTENAIQNIILQEMETLEGGILIATTNMKNNLDKAFERRFLYKLEFEKPDTQTSASIWQSNFPELSFDDALTLASRYELSGGQIENVSRKNTVSYLLSGKATNMENLAKLCEEEICDSGVRRIGFGV